MSLLRGRLVPSCSSLPSNLCPHVLSCHSSTVPPAVSLRVSSHHFTLSSKMPEHRLRCWSTTRMRGLLYERNQVFLYAFQMVLPTDPCKGITRCRPVLQHTMFMAGNVCFASVFEKDRSSPTTSLIMKSIPMSRSEVNALKKYESGRGATSPWSAGVGTEVHDLKSSFQGRRRTRQTTHGFRKDEQESDGR